MPARLRGTPWRINGEVPGSDLRSRWPVPVRSLRPLHESSTRSATARGIDRVLRVAWTVADLAGSDTPDVADVAEALTYRVAA